MKHAKERKARQDELDKNIAIEASKRYYEKSAVPLDSWMSTVVHSFMFLGLSLSTDSIWVFPLEALKHGGFFFLVVYFFVSLSIVVPLLHLEVFVSQICQAGIVQAMQMHGVGFTGFGIGIVVLTILRHHVGLHRGYYYLINIFKLFSNSESVVTCNSTYVKDAASCVSMYMDRFCRIFKRGRYLINGTCHQDAVFPESVTLASESYAHYILNIDKEGISFAVVLIQLGGLCILSLIGLRLLRLVIAFIYVVTMAIYVIVIFNFPFSKSLDVMGLVAAYSNPKVIFQAETYTCALRLSISSAGLCICGIFCASSFRKRNGNSYAIAWIAFVFNYLSCFLSVLTVVVMIYLMHDASPGSLTSFSVNKQGLAFSAATIPEFFAATQNVFASIVVPYFVGAYIINWSHSFAVFFVIHSLLRDHLPSRATYSFNAKVLLSYCTLSCFYYIVITWQFAHGIHSIEEEAVNYSLNIYICFMIIVFVYIYGKHDLEVDMVALHGQHEGFWKLFNVQNLLPAYNYCFFVTLILQIVESNALSSWMQFEFWFEDAQHEDSPYGYSHILSLFIIAVPLLIPLLYVLISMRKMKKYERFSKLFEVTPEHPAYMRRKHRFVLKAEEIVPVYELEENRGFF